MPPTAGTSFEGKRDWKEFGPRVGAAYKLSDTVVLRAAYGTFFQPVGTDYWAGFRTPSRQGSAATTA